MDAAIIAARERLKQKFGEGARSIGGKGTVRRKKKTVHKTASTDDKKLGSTLKRLGVNAIPGIEEVNIYKADGNVIHFVNPKLQASIAANTYVVSGSSEIKAAHELGFGGLGGLAGLGGINPAMLKTLQEQLAKGRGGAGGVPDMSSLLAALGAEGAGAGDDIPELEGDFEGK